MELTAVDFTMSTIVYDGDGQLHTLQHTTVKPLYKTRVLTEYIPRAIKHYRSKSVNKEIGMKVLSVYNV